MTALKPPPRRDLPMLLNRVLPALRALVEVGYFSLDVEGAEHVPRRGPVVYVGNHGGWATLDTLMAALAVADSVGPDRLPYGAAQDELLAVPGIGRCFEAVGAFPASWLRDPRALPPEMQVFSVYPEGTEGNCKPFWQAYQMRRWRTGFVRLAAALGARVVPVAILGGDECLPVAWTVRCLQPRIGTILPLPLCALPLPTRWKLVFHAPVSLGDSLRGREGDDPRRFLEQARRLAGDLRATVQRTLDREMRHRLLGRLSMRLARPAPEAAPTPRATVGVDAGAPSVRLDQ